MFGLGFGEFLVLLLVAMVVIGPRDLPRYLRKAGIFAGRLRRIAYDMREKSGIDEILRSEGLENDIAEIRRLTRGELASLTSSLRGAASLASLPIDSRPAAYVPPPSTAAPIPFHHGTGPVPALLPALTIDRAREYPTEGADAYGALPDSARVYEGSLPQSPLAEDRLYTHGEEPAERGYEEPMHEVQS